MTAALFFLPNARQLSTGGELLPNFKLKFYLSNTDTPAAVYADADLNTELGTTVQADGDGHMPPIYLDAEVAYRVKVLDQNDILQPDGDVDPINVVSTGSPTPTTASDIARTVFDEHDVCHGYHLTKQGVIISKGGSGWKQARVESPNVFWDPKIAKYRMVYLGYSGTSGSENQASLGYATADSPEGPWTEFGSNPFFGPSGNSGDPDQNGTSGPFVWMENGTYYLFYIGLPATGLEQGTKTICLATSTDFVTWTRRGAIIQPGSGWRAVAVWHPWVGKRGDTYYLFFNATDGANSNLHESIGYATSANLTSWTVQDADSPVLDVGAANQWDDERVGDPYLWRIRDTWYMSYYGHRTSTDKTQEGYATCADADFPAGPWTKYASNPIIAVGGSFDSKAAGRSCHFITGLRHYVWYTTDDGSFGIDIAFAIDSSIDPAATPSFVGCRAYNNAVQTISNNSSTAVTFNSEAYDTDGIHSTSSNQAQFVCPSGKAGKWRFDYKVAFAANASGSRFAFLRKNNDGTDGTNVIGSTAVGIPNSTEVAGVFGGCTVDLAVGDNVQLIVYQNRGGNLDIGSSSDIGLQTAMECHYLG